jgi:hypothetical protein
VKLVVDKMETFCYTEVVTQDDYSRHRELRSEGEIIMEKVTVGFLRSLGACAGQVALFEETFPDGAAVTVEAALQAMGAGLTLNWLASRLPPPALAEYERVTFAAEYEYGRVTEAALDEYERVTTEAWAEYKRLTAPALAEYEYERLVAAAWAEYERVTEAALAEYKRAECAALVAALKML